MGLLLALNSNVNATDTAAEYDYTAAARVGAMLDYLNPRVIAGVAQLSIDNFPAKLAFLQAYVPGAIAIIAGSAVASDVNIEAEQTDSEQNSDYNYGY